MKKISFTKMQGAGNDFIVIDHAEGIDYSALAIKACHRNFGIGADGLLVLDRSATSDFKMRIINADGSEAEMCGNGARCMAAYIAGKGVGAKETFTMETLAGVIHGSARGEVARVQLNDPKDYRSNIAIDLGDRQLTGHFINTGVPHTVIFVERLNDVDVEGIGRQIRHHTAFAPKGTNVNFVERVQDGVVALRTYERGVEAETLACGTGSVAAALIGFIQGHKTLTAHQLAAIKVLTKSGEMLDVSFDLAVKDQQPVISNVWLKGSGKFICKGEYYGV